MNGLKEWWNQAPSRDQLALVLCGACVALYLLFVAVYQPIKGVRDEQLKFNKAQLRSLERVRMLAGEYANQSKSNRKANKRASIENIVQRSLAPNNLQVSSMDASGRNGVRVRFENANFENFLTWLNEMETAQSLRVKDLSVAAGSESGTVSVNLRLHQD